MAQSEHADDSLSLEQIEADAWGDAAPDSSTLVATVHRLRRATIASLDAEALRLLIAQRVGLQVLVPRVLARLEADPLLEGDFYPGDVLVATLKVPADYWAANPTQRQILGRILDSIENVDAELRADIDAFRTAP